MYVFKGLKYCTVYTALINCVHTKGENEQDFTSYPAPQNFPPHPCFFLHLLLMSLTPLVMKKMHRLYFLIVKFYLAACAAAAGTAAGEQSRGEINVRESSALHCAHRRRKLTSCFGPKPDVRRVQLRVSTQHEFTAVLHLIFAGSLKENATTCQLSLWDHLQPVCMMGCLFVFCVFGLNITLTVELC